MFRKLAKGFGIIEILVALGVLTVGILGVTKLHSVITSQSQENRARNEAMMIAQARIEELRNYTGTVTSQTAFDTTYANTSGYANSLSVTGVSATYTRTEQISTNANNSTLKDIAVKVDWTDSKAVAQTVGLTSQVSYIPPRSTGDSALTSSGTKVKAPTGRASLGAGTLPNGAATTSNGDGTSLYKDGSTNLRLVSGTTIVLTLANACQTNTGTCIDFVKIKGRVYIDTATQTSLAPGNVFVQASDAAFCSRYYTDTNGAIQAVANTTTTTRTTANSNYKYFDYTCYLGGGWQGNIGILLGGGNGSNDKTCVGDPTVTSAYKDTVVAARRVYRGMLYKISGNGRETVTGTNPAMTRYYSYGIKDSTVFPVGTAHTHDFVIASLSTNTASQCGNTTTAGVLKRTDATVSGVAGGLFTGNPTDFVCLNGGYLDTYDTSVYGSDSTCPWDPSNPPSSDHSVTGVIRLTTTQTTGNAALATAMYADTSDGPNNCSITSAMAWNASGYYQASYSCIIWDWGSGWNGYIEAMYDQSQVNCSTKQKTGTAVTTNQTSGYDFTTCTTGSYAVYSGTVTAAGNRKLTAVAMSGTGSTCTLAGDGLSYSCTTAALSNGATWTGTLTFTISGGYNCTGSPLSFSNKAGGNYTQNVTIAANSNGC